jgi:hypothetical protein
VKWIIDGHNLIPHVRGLSLADIDDEQALIDLLNQFCRIKRDHALVFFDRAAPGQSGERGFGLVKGIFVPSSQTADAAIAAYLQKRGSRARNETLVSSDRMVQAAARPLHMHVISADVFARQIEAALNQAPIAEVEKPLSDEEVLRWEQLFNQSHNQGETQTRSSEE